MTDRELMLRLHTALDHAAPDDVAGVLAGCGPQPAPAVRRKAVPVRHRRRAACLAAACLALVLLCGAGGLAYRQITAVASVISLDVNPSIEMKVNRNERVLSCTGLNADAAAVLFDMNGGQALVGARLDTAVNAVVDALMRSGYLDGMSSAILISVEDNNTARGERIQQELTATVGGTLHDAASQAAVLTQTITVDAGLNAQAQQNNISSGKAYLVDQVAAMNDDLSFEDLAPLSVEELRDMRETGAPAMPIGKDAALRAALASVGLDASVCAGTVVDPQLGDAAPSYTVKLVTGGQEYVFAVDAYTGDVLSGPDSIIPATPAPTAAPEPTPGPEADASDEPAPTAAPQQIPAGGTVAVATPAPVADIGMDAAKAAALAHAGVAEDAVTQVTVERKTDGGRLAYAVIFAADGCEYEYTIDGATGQVLGRKTETIPGNNASADPSGDPCGEPAPGGGTSDEPCGEPVPVPEITDSPSAPEAPGEDAVLTEPAAPVEPAVPETPAPTDPAASAEESIAPMAPLPPAPETEVYPDIEAG